MINCNKYGTERQQLELMDIIEEYNKENISMVTILEKVQDIYGYLPKSVLEFISAKTNTPISQIYGIATFYAFFRLTPVGKYTISVCLGTACYVKGGQQILDKVCSMLKIQPGQTTTDGLFTIDQTRCIGRCNEAPVVSINDKVFSYVTQSKMVEILKPYLENKI